MIKCVVSAPVNTFSGYGQRSVDFVEALIQARPDWQIEILSQRWGDCRQGYLKEMQKWDILSRIVKGISYTPDVWIQITVPNEFQRVGKFNIGVTAGMETNLVDLSWTQGFNRMDLVLVSSNHGLQSFLGTVHTDNRTGAQTRAIPEKGVVLFEGIRTEDYYEERKPKKFNLPGLTNAWNYLFVGHWLQGRMGEDRKNVGLMIKVFLETFKDKDGQVPGLILKTSSATTSYIDEEETLKKIYDIREGVQYKKSLPNIYLLHGDLTDEEMNLLYNDPRIKAMVSFTKGEGYGRPLAEFALTGKPILCSGWSGMRDFLSTDYTAYVGGKLDKVDASAAIPGMILREASWFRPDLAQMQAGFQVVFDNYGEWFKKAQKQKELIKKNFSFEAMVEALKKILDERVPSFPEQVDLNLNIPGVSDILK